MCSLQAILGKGARFQRLLEQAAEEAHASVRLVVDLLQAPNDTVALESLAAARRNEKKIAERIGEELVKTFVTGLDREDIEALSLALYKIPKTVQRLAERLAIARAHVAALDLAPQTGMMMEATDVVLEMVVQLRDMGRLERVRGLNDKLQRIEGEADKLMVDLLRDLYSGRHDAMRVMITRDLYELIEKVVDRCRDAGNVVMHIVLKNS